MNSNLETCRNCEHQCRLQEDADRVAVSLRAKKITDAEEIRKALSTMALKGSQNGCPSPEIGRIKQIASESLDPDHAVSPLFNYRIRGATTDKSHYDLPQGNNPNRKLDRWRS